MKNVQDTEEYRKIHFAVMAIESGAEKLNISGQEMEDRLQKQDLIRKRLLDQYRLCGRRHFRNPVELGTE